MVVGKRDYIFEMCMSVDGRYMIVRDSVFDIQEQKTIGNLWRSIDTFKTIFNNIKLEDEDYKKIQENINNLPLVESERSLYELRDILLEWDFFQDTWVGKELKSSGESLVKFAQDSWEGLKEFGVAISKGDWKEILGLLAKGVRFVLRKLKDALYSAVGMTVDAILIAIGVGKGAQMVAWGLVLALDIYQMISGDWPEHEKNAPLWQKWLDIGFDILGFVAAGIAAKGAKAFFKPLLSLGEAGSGKIARWFAANPRAGEFISKIIKMAEFVPSKLGQLSANLAKKFPAGAKFVNSILGGIGKVITSMIESLKKLRGGYVAVTGGTGKYARGFRAGLETGGILYGFHKVTGHTPRKGALGDDAGKIDDLQKALKFTTVQADWDNPDIIV